MGDEQPIQVDLRAWAPGDLALLERLLGDPSMMTHLGGPETPEKIRERHARYCRSSASGADAQFAIVAGSAHAAAGWIGYWEREWQGQTVLEAGWSVLPELQGRGIATRAARLLADRARSNGRYRALHAFPAVDNPASNAVCRKAGFRCLGEVDFEYPRGHFLRCNDWSLELTDQNR